MSKDIELYPPSVVYVLLEDTDGNYCSCPEIKAIFSSYEEALKTQKTMALFDAYIEEYELR